MIEKSRAEMESDVHIESDRGDAIMEHVLLSREDAETAFGKENIDAETIPNDDGLEPHVRLVIGVAVTHRDVQIPITLIAYVEDLGNGDGWDMRYDRVIGAHRTRAAIIRVCKVAGVLVRFAD